ncbi:MAG: hypothetical protein A2Z18_01410 [Armatimonadetes bacterium RBG_16_58_9]|nr:MAG: hypothetical protein A2Z18_01410 [Armatimonadetes bacterium RBG_16_58_9]
MASEPEVEFKILIVDDDRELLDTLSCVLSSERYHVTCAQSGAEGISLLEAGEYDLILVDLRMRRMDGQQFLRFVKLLYPRCPVVLMSAYATAEAVVKANREGAYDCLLKPFKLTELQDILHRASREAQSAT